MATQIKKTVTGPMTAIEDGPAGVLIQFPDEASASLKLSDLKPEVVQRLAIHGLSQKLGDSYAGAAKVEGETPLAFAKRRVAEVIQQLLNGEWRVTTEGGPRVTELAKGLARATGKTVEEAVQALADKQAELDNEEKKKADNPWKQWSAELRAQPAVDEAIKAIRLEEAQAAAAKKPAEAAKPTIDLGGMFSASSKPGKPKK